VERVGDGAKCKSKTQSRLGKTNREEQGESDHPTTDAVIILIRETVVPMKMLWYSESFQFQSCSVSYNLNATIHAVRQFQAQVRDLAGADNMKAQHRRGKEQSAMPPCSSAN
jgi:hypothetical protein